MIMYILGIHGFSHDANAALLEDGVLISFYEEERLSRKKHDDGFPYLAIAACLTKKAISLDDIDIVAIDMLSGMATKCSDEIKKMGYKNKIVFVRHHDSHAAASYYASGYEEAAVLIVDGHGSNADEVFLRDKHYLHSQGDHAKYELQSFYRGHGGKLRLIDRTIGSQDYRNGIGILYTLASYLIGFGEFGAGKVMGLSPYGEPDHEYSADILKIFGEKDIVLKGRDSITDNMTYYCKKYFNSVKPRVAEPLPDKTYTNLAYKVQNELEKSLIHLCNYLYEITGCKKLCFGGGVALNGVANMKILEQTKFEDIYIFPATSDTGVAIGNAVYVWKVMMEQKNKFQFENAYWGTEYPDESIEQLINNYREKLLIQRVDNIYDEAAASLSKGRIIGWYQGRSEVGPRALGNRSILADPRPLWMKDKINAEVKHREAFRPFAPSVLEEHCHEYFQLDKQSPYMLLMASVRKEKKAFIPAVVHVDGTARIQTVNSNQNERFYELIKAFYKKTGIPLLLNTSFNVAGQPIVETPKDAIECFLRTGIDELVINHYYIKRR